MTAKPPKPPVISCEYHPYWPLDEFGSCGECQREQCEADEAYDAYIALEERKAEERYAAQDEAYELRDEWMYDFDQEFPL